MNVKKKPRILAVSDAAFSATGYGNQAEMVLSRLVKRGWDVYQIGCNSYDLRKCEPGDEKSEFYPTYKGIKIIKNDEMNRVGMDGLYSTKEAIWAIYESLKPDLIWSVNDFYRVAGMSEFAQEFLDKWVHWMPIDNPYSGSGWSDFINRLRFLIFISSFGWDQYAGVIPNVMYKDALYHAVPSDIFHPLLDKNYVKGQLGISNNAFVVVTVGRHQPRKMIWKTTSVMAKFLAQHKDVVWICKSDPNDPSMMEHPDGEKNLIGILDSHGVKDRVKFEPRQISAEDMNDIYNSGDIFIHLSGGEGFGIPYVESMLAGTPCILTDNTTSPELTGGWEFGLPVKVASQMKLLKFNSVYDVADEDDALKQLNFAYDDWRNGGKWLKEASRKGVEFHRKWCDAEVVVDKWEEILWRMIRYNNKIVWHSEFGRGTGYTITSETMIPILEKMGYDIYVSDWNNWQSPILSDDIKNLAQKTAAMPAGKLDDAIYADFYLQETFPFVKGKHKIGWAFVENTVLRKTYVDCCNKMDMILTSSEFCKSAMKKSGVKSEIRIIPPWVDGKKYPEMERPDIGTRPFTFLHIGVRQERKNTEQLVNAYMNAFPDPIAANVRLIIKSNDFGRLEDLKLACKRNDIEFIHTAEKPLTHDEMLELYGRSDCYVNVSHGEGIGNPDMESLSTGLPVIGSDWDTRGLFLSNDTGWIVPVSHMELAYKVFNEYCGEWAAFKTEDIIKCLQEARANPQMCREKGKYGAKMVRENFPIESGAKAMDETFMEMYMKNHSHEINNISNEVVKTNKVIDPSFFDKNYYTNQHKYTPDWHEGVAQNIINITNGLEGNILDIGCGTGFLMKHLLAHDKNVVGIEISQYAVDNPLPGCEGRIFYGDAADIPYDDKSFDWAVSFSTLEHIPEELAQKALDEMRRVSKKAFVEIAMPVPGGITEEQLKAEDPSHINIKSFDWWKERIEKAGLKIVWFDNGMNMVVESMR